MERRTIFYANVTVRHNKKTAVLTNVVFKHWPDGKYHNLKHLKTYGITAPADVLNVEVIKELGKETHQAYKIEILKARGDSSIKSGLGKVKTATKNR